MPYIKATICRELTFVEEECGQKWPEKMIKLLLEMKKEAEKEIPGKYKSFILYRPIFFPVP
jgi:hypothetical protein